MGSATPRVNVTPERAAELWRGIWSYSEDEERTIRNAFTQYVFYEPISKTEKMCYCTACRSEFSIKKQCIDSDNWSFSHSKHGDQSRCPMCGENVTTLALGKYRNFRSLEEIQKIVIFKEIKGLLYAMAIKARLRYNFSEPHYPELDIAYYAMYCFPSASECVQWKCEYDYSTYSWSDWMIKRNICEPFPANYLLGHDCGYYIIGIDEIEKTPLKYCGIEQYLENTEDLTYTFEKPIKYLGFYTHYNQMEMVAKMMPQSGILKSLVVDGYAHRGVLNWRAKTVEKFLKLSKNDAKTFINQEMSICRLIRWKTEEALSGKSLFEYAEEVKFFEGYFSDVKVIDSHYHIGIKKIKKYIEKQKNSNYGSVKRVVGYWKDYLDAAQKLSYDLSKETVLMPKDLRERHDIAVAQVDYEKNEAEKEEYAKKIYRRLKKKYSYEKGDLSIIVPKSMSEIVTEGKVLSHCVGGYAERHCKGKLVILFLRKKEQIKEPYVTIEMNGNEIVQIHGFKNEFVDGVRQESPMVTHKEFLNQWQRWLEAGSQRTKQGSPIIAKQIKKQILADAV